MEVGTGDKKMHKKVKQIHDAPMPWTSSQNDPVLCVARSPRTIWTSLVSELHCPSKFRPQERNGWVRWGRCRRLLLVFLPCFSSLLLAMVRGSSSIRGVEECPGQEKSHSTEYSRHLAVVRPPCMRSVPGCCLFIRRVMGDKASSASQFYCKGGS